MSEPSQPLPSVLPPERPRRVVRPWLIVPIVVLGLLCLAAPILLLMLALTHAHEHAHRTSCRSNLRQIGTSAKIWSSAHRQRWPDAFASGQETGRWDRIGGTRADEDSFDARRDGDVGDNKGETQANTASLWLLVANTGLEPRVFVCPSSRHTSDAQVLDYKSVRDFRGDRYVSYSYQNELGDYQLKETAAPAWRLAVMADCNPMRRDFRSGAPRGGKPQGATDRRLARKPKFPPSDQTDFWNRQTGPITDPWELNSPNHGFQGQNVLYLDGHVEWAVHPYCGPKWDNIWLRRKAGVEAEADPARLETLRAYNDTSSYDGTSTLDPKSEGDSFLVP